MDRDRLIPMSESLTQACQKYADKIWWDKDTDYFFMAPDHTMISPNTIYGKFRVYLKVMGISHGGKGQGPRLHDLRHTFAVHVLQKWVTGGFLCFPHIWAINLSVPLPDIFGSLLKFILSY